MAYFWSVDAEAGPSRPPATKRRKRRNPAYNAASVLPLALPFLASAHASPLETPTPARRYPPPRVTLAPRHGEEENPDSPLVYLTSVSAPTHLPTTTVTLDQTVLPYVLTKGDDGKWRRVNNAWSLYGREAGVDKGGVLVGDDSGNSFVVESNLPKGWGQQSNRTSFYKVPLIVISSVILAVAIVIGIIIMVFNRRKAHRKARRRAERKRRKELEAAGISPNDINGAGAEAAFKEKLTELDKQHRIKKRDGHVGFARVKVKRWTTGLRRRKGKPDEPVIEAIHEKPKPEELPGESPSLHSISDVMAGDTTDPTDSNHSSRPTDSSPETSQDTGEPETDAPYLPPEYRPASVRSYHADGAGPSRRRGSAGDLPHEAPMTDKTRAPGYYPAPATRDTEEAMDVVSRAEGKRPLPPPSPEEERVRHIATDDKRLLEQMRLGASAPPQVAEGEGAGPSAPQVELDLDGFERADHFEEVPNSVPETSLHPDIPAPPRPTAQRFVSEPTSELHLVPSAPPLGSPSAPLAPPIPPPAPSAPPLADPDADADECGTSAPPVPSAPPAPSAPPFDIPDTEDDGELESETPHAEQSEQPGATLFLPRYEP